MKSIGVRDLRQSASAVLREVELGESFEVTDRGRPVAILAPLSTGDLLEQLRLAGEITPASRTGALPGPLPLPRGKASPSENLARARRNER